MGLFDKMFGGGASAAQGQPDADKRFNELKMKYQSVLNTIQREGVQLRNLHVENNKLVIRGSAPSDEVKNKVWEQIKLVDGNYDADLAADIDAGMAVAAGAEGRTSGEKYTIKSGDSLSKISKHFYGDANEWNRIYYANKDRIGDDPDKIQAGWELTIPK